MLVRTEDVGAVGIKEIRDGCHDALCIGAIDQEDRGMNHSTFSISPLTHHNKISPCRMPVATADGAWEIPDGKGIRLQQVRMYQDDRLEPPRSAEPAHRP